MKLLNRNDADARIRPTEFANQLRAWVARTSADIDRPCRHLRHARLWSLVDCLPPAMGVVMAEKTYLFEYGFDGDRYGLHVHAKSLEDAHRKIGMMQYARYKGEVAAIIPLSPRGIWARLFG